MALALAVASACSTGIESTKKIRMNKEDMRMMEKTEEEVFAAALKGSPLSEWKEGKPFLAMSDRTLYVFEPAAAQSVDAGNLKGKVLHYAGMESRVNPDLKQECVLLFTDGTSIFRYNTGRPVDMALREVDSSKLPLLADIDLTSRWNETLKGRKLWTRSNLWYDDNGNRKQGLRYVEVEVIEVTPATGDFPANVRIRHAGEEALMHINYTSEKGDSRNFAAIFFLSDPKSRYPNISDRNWQLIQNSKVDRGMTKDECRLSLGNPDELQSGHNTSQTLDIWQYSDGTYLFFSDGILTNFRQ